MVVVINKVDLLPAELRHRLVAKARKRLAQTFAATTFAGCPMVAVSAKPGAPPLPRASDLKTFPLRGLNQAVAWHHNVALVTASIVADNHWVSSDMVDGSGQAGGMGQRRQRRVCRS